MYLAKKPAWRLTLSVSTTPLGSGRPGSGQARERAGPVGAVLLKTVRVLPKTVPFCSRRCCFKAKTGAALSKTTSCSLRQENLVLLQVRPHAPYLPTPVLAPLQLRACSEHSLVGHYRGLKEPNSISRRKSLWFKALLLFRPR